MRISPAVYAVMVVVAAAAALLPSTEGQQPQPQPPCVANLQLGLCLPYLNGTAAVPDPESCCQPVRSFDDSAVACFCQLLNVTQLLQQLQINPSLALGLPQKCGATYSVANCAADNGQGGPVADAPAPPPADQAAAPGSIPSVASPPASDQPPPPATPSDSPASPIGGTNAAPTTGTARAGYPSLMAICLIWWWSVLA